MKIIIIFIWAVSLLGLSACTPSDRDEVHSEAAIVQVSHQTEPEIILDEPEIYLPGSTPSDGHENATNTDIPEVSDAETVIETSPGLTESLSPGNSTEEPADSYSQQSQQEDSVPTQSSQPESPVTPTVPQPDPSKEPVPQSELSIEPTSEPEPVPEEPEEPEEVAFNVDDWVNFAVTYGQQIGLTYDPGVTECWDNPIIASPNSIYLERDITARLNRYLNRGMSAFSVWSQLRSDGRYDIYIAYA